MAEADNSVTVGTVTDDEKVTDTKTVETENSITPGEQEDGSYIVLLPNRNQVKIGEEVLTYITVTEPDVAKMKGDSVLQINNAGVDQLKKILPHCTYPILTAPVLNKLKLSDINVLAGALLHFMYGSEIDDNI